VLLQCQESTGAELQEARLKRQEMKVEVEAKLNKERDVSRHELEKTKVGYEEKIREFKEEIKANQAVRDKQKDASGKTISS